jgi:hypothetical protein
MLGASRRGHHAWAKGADRRHRSITLGPAQFEGRQPIGALGRSPDEIWLTIASDIMLFCIPQF